MSKMEEKQLVLSRQLSAEQERQKSSEGRLRSFYQRQMESILAKKVEQLQNHVSEMEQGLIKEREEALQGLKWQNEKAKPRILGKKPRPCSTRPLKDKPVSRPRSRPPETRPTVSGNSWLWHKKDNRGNTQGSEAFSLLPNGLSGSPA